MTNIKTLNLLLVIIFLYGCGGSADKASSTAPDTSIPANTPPTAIAGDDIETYVSTTVFLDGSDSFDSESAELTYSWSIITSPENSNADIYYAETTKPQFISSMDGDYIIQLTVTDEEGASSQSDIVVTVNELGQKDVTLLTQELVDNKAKWESQNIQHYQIDQRVSCFCFTPPVILQVKDEDKSLVYYTNRSIWYEEESLIDRDMMVSEENKQSFRTINEAFSLIESGLKDADSVIVSYHPELGYPQKVYIDWSLSSADEESSFSIANLINLSDTSCDDIDNNYPNLQLNIVNEDTAEPISCDVIVDFKNSDGEDQQVVNDEYVSVGEFNIVGLINCSDNLPVILETETGGTSLKIAKEGYITKTVELNIPEGESCGLIPTTIEVMLDPVN
ncbi:DUF6174 domain-containing protein [Colwellia sp. 4_MG-2023]|uniref:DUF6174 domain-containing protein n=1 Tax=unclassified Colwellia TaxID=196834 RepID=UPI0026E1648B|nr:MULTISPECIES: DUF6174 domain-containing protein [unclassified Colwellia]MDO6505560.1 DUF6174 domain-containing protein [Colwellia sp. 5_MG-2023]MDO6554144.1 DUF6174 domain-containing protein [Colwellia sp. 4_MG-2023]